MSTPISSLIDQVSAGSDLDPAVVLGWRELIRQTIRTKVALPPPGYYPDFQLPDPADVARLQEGYRVQVSDWLTLVDERPDAMDACRDLVTRLRVEPQALLNLPLADLDRWELQAERRHGDRAYLAETAADLDLEEEGGTGEVS